MTNIGQLKCEFDSLLRRTGVFTGQKIALEQGPYVHRKGKPSESTPAASGIRNCDPKSGECVWPRWHMRTSCLAEEELERLLSHAAETNFPLT